MSKLKKEAERLLRAIEFEPVPLSKNKGKCIRNDHCPSKFNSKKRRHKGWITPKLAGKYKYSKIFEEGLEPQLMYEPWTTRKDGIHFDPDETHIRSEFMSGGGRCRNCNNLCKRYDDCFDKNRPISEINEKLKKHYKIRKAKKERKKNPNPISLLIFIFIFI